MTVPSKILFFFSPDIFQSALITPLLAIVYNINAAQTRMGLSNEAAGAEDLCPHHMRWGVQGVDLASLYFACGQVSFCFI